MPGFHPHVTYVTYVTYVMYVRTVRNVRAVMLYVIMETFYVTNVNV